MWIRTCQECGHKQEAKSPKEYKGDSWTELKCKACNSTAMDYGKEDYSDRPYGEWCRDPSACKGKGYCPLDPNCGD